MCRARSLLCTTLSAWALLIAGCPKSPVPDGSTTDGDSDADADADAADGDADGDHDADADVLDGDTPPASGPMTFICAEAVFSTERLCDIDDDGDLDNSIADLGSPAADTGVMVLNTFIAGRMAEDSRVILHLPYVEDHAGPNDDDVVAIFADGLDTDLPPDPTDDYLGGETFYVKPEYVDPCGEPLHHFEEARVEEGWVSAHGGDILLPVYTDVPFSASSATGTIEPYGTGGTLTVCVYATISAFGGGTADSVVEDLTMLEFLLAGGSIVGLPGMPGLTPDLDLDGDGLELFIIDEDGRIVSCVDGDHTVIEGRDCWRDEAMADGFSMVMTVIGVPAILAGIEPGWQSRVEGTCDEPPAESLWDEI